VTVVGPEEETLKPSVSSAPQVGQAFTQKLLAGRLGIRTLALRTLSRYSQAMPIADPPDVFDTSYNENVSPRTGPLKGFMGVHSSATQIGTSAAISQCQRETSLWVAMRLDLSVRLPMTQAVVRTIGLLIA
jgi:hypothetical protein